MATILFVIWVQTKNWINTPVHYICWSSRQEAMALSMALLLTVKFPKSDERSIIQNETSWHLSLWRNSNQWSNTAFKSCVCSNSPTISAMIEIEAQCTIFLLVCWFLYDLDIIIYNSQWSLHLEKSWLKPPSTPKYDVSCSKNRYVTLPLAYEQSLFICLCLSLSVCLSVSVSLSLSLSLSLPPSLSLHVYKRIIDKTEVFNIDFTCGLLTTISIWIWKLNTGLYFIWWKVI